MSFEAKVTECLAQITLVHLHAAKIDPRTLRIMIKLSDNDLGHALFDKIAESPEMQMPKAAAGARMESMLKIMKLTAFFIEELKKIETP